MEIKILSLELDFVGFFKLVLARIMGKSFFSSLLLISNYLIPLVNIKSGSLMDNG